VIDDDDDVLRTGERASESERCANGARSIKHFGKPVSQRTRLYAAFEMFAVFVLKKPKYH
jgi:hypothetical protein